MEKALGETFGRRSKLFSSARSRDWTDALSGMGELHLEIFVDRLFREHKVKANVGKPQVSFVSPSSETAKGEAFFEKELGGQLHYAKCVVEVSPLDRDSGNEVIF